MSADRLVFISFISHFAYTLLSAAVDDLSRDLSL